MKQTSKQNSTRDIEINKKLTVTRGEEGGGKKVKVCQRTCIKDPWTDTGGWVED